MGSQYYHWWCCQCTALKKGTNLGGEPGNILFGNVGLGRGEFEKEKLLPYVKILLWFIINIKINQSLN